MKEILIETQQFHPNKTQILESKSPNGNLLVEGILVTVENENGNGRFYPKNIWERELNKYQTLIKENRAVGELDHPEEAIINLKNVSHCIRKTWWDNKNIMGVIEILPTPSGNILKALLENNILVGVSSRGMGSLIEENGKTIVDDDFELSTWDFVSTPSNDGSWMRPIKGQINESLLKSYSKYQQVDQILQEILCNHGNCCLKII